MGKLAVIKKKLVTLIFALGIIAVAICFSFLLGKYYLDNVVKSYPVTQTVYTKVYYPVKIKKMRLQPLSVYTLQAGVFTDKAGATQFANSLTSSGLRPVVSPQAPYKVFVFAAPTRSSLEKFKEYAPLDAFIANDILNEKEIEVRADNKFWLEFLPRFSELYAQTLDVIVENDSSNDKELSLAWEKLANNLRKENSQEQAATQAIETLTQDIEGIASILKSQRISIQDKGSAAQIILKTKYDYDNLRGFLAKFD